MTDAHDDRPISELNAVRPPPRPEAAARAARQRILARAEPLLARRRRPRSALETLATWARPGLIAASIALLMLAAGLRLRGRSDDTPALVMSDDVLASGSQVPALLVAVNEPDADAVLAAALLETNGASAADPGAGQNSGEER